MSSFNQSDEQPRRAIVAGGRSRTLSQHMLNSPHLGITDEHVSHVLEHWVVRGIFTAADGQGSWNYIAFVPGLNQMVRVAVSVDDEIVISAFRDRNATTQWNRSNHSYFASKYSNLEIRDELKG
jgi:hypothetical protein